MSFTGSPNRDPWNNKVQQEPDVKSAADNQNTDGGKKTAGNKPDNAGVDDETIDNIWNEVKKDADVQNNNDSNNNNNNNQPLVKPEDQIKEYLSSVGLAPIALSDSDKAELQAGNFDGVIGRINQNIQTAHMAAVKSSNTLIDQKVARAVEEAVGKSKSFVAGQRSLEALHKALPYTADAAISPVAQTVMQRFIDRGATQEQAIEGVKKWSKRLADAVNPPAKVNPNLNGQYRGAQNENSGDVDWLTLLSPGN